MRNQRVVYAVGALIGCFGVAIAAQTRTATLDDVVAEIRGLRAEMSRSANATVRTQLLVARMQIQEQRINLVTRQITEVQTQLAQVKQVIAQMEVPLKQAEAELARATGDERREMELSVADAKLRFGTPLAQLQQRVQDLTFHESELMNQFATEQVRWTDFNERLDALERSLQDSLR